jgi:hypothetical protein
MPGMEIVLAVMAALAVACGAVFIKVTVRTFNRGFRNSAQDFLQNKKSVIMVVCSLGLFAGGAVDRKHPILAIVIVVIGFAVALTVARVRR